MWHFFAKDRGFTLFEVLIVVVIVGILAALGIPNLMGIINASKVKDAQSQVQGIIRGAQRQAISNSVDCELQINISKNPITISDTNPKPTIACLSASTLVLPRDIKILTTLTGTPPTLKFNFKGRSNKGGTIVFYSDRANQKRCLVIALYMGMMRTGEYTGKVTEKIDPTLCKTTTNLL